MKTPESPAAEAFRNLRAALSLLGPEVERKVSLFTSAVPNEGNSFTSANYSLALAQQGYRVLLIDGDLRRPNMHRIFHFPQPAKTNNSEEEDGAPGVMDCLVGEADVASAARRFQPAKSISLPVKLPWRETFSPQQEGNFPCWQGDDAHPIQLRFWPVLSLVNWSLRLRDFLIEW